MSVVVEIAHRAGPFHLDVSFTLGSGLTALVGPSGSGKTTILNVIAGLVRPNRGLVRLDRQDLTNTASRTWLAPHQRRIGYVFQEPRLFPHLTVRQNLLYGHWFHRRLIGGLEPAGVITLLNLGGLLSRRPARLSGGEKQRVALGRALLAKPALLLLDEPLASVDQAHRAEILPYLDRIRAEYDVPAIYVTHTWTEIAGRANHVIELHNGIVAFNGSVAEAEAQKGRIEWRS